MNIVERIVMLAKQEGISITSLEAKLGISRGIIKSWMTAQPTADKITKIANYFHVSVDYLLGRTDDPNGFSCNEDDSILQLQRAVSRMTVEDKDRMMKILKAGFEYAFDDTKNTKQE